jgi:hypothetical protein
MCPNRDRAHIFPRESLSHLFHALVGAWQLSRFSMNIAVNERQFQAACPDKRSDFRPIARALGTVMDFPAGEIIFREGDAPRYTYVVLRGKVERARLAAPGDQRAALTGGCCGGALLATSGVERSGFTAFMCPRHTKTAI